MILNYGWTWELQVVQDIKLGMMMRTLGFARYQTMDEQENSRFYNILNYGWTGELQVLQDIKLGMNMRTPGSTRY